MSNFDLSSLALASAFPTNKILTDDKGLAGKWPPDIRGLL